MSHKFPEREFVDKGFSRAAVEWLRDVNSTALATISLDTTEIEALVHEFRTLKAQFDELKFQNEQLLNGLPDQVIEDMSKNVIIRSPTTGTGAEVNQYTDRLLTAGIDYAHSKVHAGNFYSVSRIENTVADTNSLEFFIITGSTYELHTQVGAGFGGDCELYLFEGTTVSANGTSLTAYNNDRTSSNTAESSFYYAPTITADGTQLYADFLPGGSGVFAGGGSGGGPIRSGTEIILNQSTNYLIRLTNTSGSAIDLSLAIGFYENA